jgi:hypothetical protein
LGLRQSAENTQPEIFKWADMGDSHVICTFQDGKLQTWELTRPAEETTDTPTEKTPAI